MNPLVYPRQASDGRPSPHARPFRSVGASLAEDGPERLHHDIEVQRQRPVLDVELVETDRLFGRHPAPAVNLPPARDAGWHLVSWAEQLEVGGDLVGGKGTRPDKAHLPLEDVPEL